MGKIESNKQQKLEALLQSAYELFLTVGIKNTSISDIANNAGVAKGTFYLYFHDKEEIRNKLIARSAEQIFLNAHKALQEMNIKDPEDQIIFVVDYILDYMQKHKTILKFVSKNLSWGIFEKAISNGACTASPVLNYFGQLFTTGSTVTFRDPEIMLFLITELTSASSYSVILEDDPISYDRLKPYLNDSIRAIVRNHIVRD